MRGLTDNRSFQIMSTTINSPKTPHGNVIPILIDKPSQPHRSTFHLSNLFHSITKFRRTIRTNNSFVRSTSTNPNDQQVKLTRRSFSKKNPLSPSIHRPSSCFILLSPSKQEHQTCLFFQKPSEDITSPKVNSSSSFSKIKRVSSFLLPLKRRQSLSLNHSLHERSFKAKESTKRRSRLLNSSIFKSKTPSSTHSFSLSGIFGDRIEQPSRQSIGRPLAIVFDLIKIDLILERRSTRLLYDNYQSIVADSPNWSWMQYLKSFFGIFFDKQTLILFQPKLFAFDHSNAKPSIQPDFLYLPFHSHKYDEFSSIHIGYDQSAPTTIRIPLYWIFTKDRLDYQISSKVCVDLFDRRDVFLLIFRIVNSSEVNSILVLFEKV